MRSVLDVTEDTFDAEVLKVGTSFIIRNRPACNEQVMWPALPRCEAVTLCDCAG